ncbi:putative sugar nucleotidyl transferase [Arachidicoccus terrestris]|uniref:putative sugar nucleotidyl transferase n=1 Tax=Arachidicoccus terrestris TaxID=2875539 RepID=UPI001CC59268|nr:putative sugar nucleotidyl transferase [Arachidicoccus terrestris]UAY54123.1 hypothetical protein K9M52_11660 [Arachidicoccus terrestris]
MAIYLFETLQLRQRFYPLTRNKNVADLQLGGYELAFWWQHYNEEIIHILTEDYLQTTIPAFMEPGDILVHGASYPGQMRTLLKKYHSDKKGVGFKLKGINVEKTDGIAAVCIKERLSTEAVRTCLFNSTDADIALAALLEGQNITWTIPEGNIYLSTPEQLLKWQGAGIRMSVAAFTDIMEGTTGRESQPLDKSNRITGDHPVIIKEGAIVRMSLLNTESGPICIGKDASVMEGSMLRGPLYLGDRSVIKMGTRIYGPVVTGADCVLGGEIKNVIFHEGSNKGHEGYLGDSIIGAWCNFGAGSGGSNLKNTAGEVRLYDYASQNYRKVGLKFGALVGDYTRTGVGTQLTTGSSIGLCCHLFGQQMPPRLVADFSWGTGHDLDTYQLEKAIQHIGQWRKFKGSTLTDREIRILHHIFGQAR